MNLQLVTYKGLKTSQKDFDRRPLSSSEIQVGDLILLYNNKRKDKKEGKFLLHDLVPFIVSEITLKGVTTLKKREGEILKVNYNFSQLKLYVEEKTADTGVVTTEFTVAVD